MALILSLLLFGCAEQQQAKAGWDEPDPASNILDIFYKHHDLEKPKNKGLALFAAQETERYAELLGISEYVPTMLSMWHRESGYEILRGDDGRSFGITQTMPRKERKWRRYWYKRGLGCLGSLDDPSTQIAFGVAEFNECLRMSKHDEYDAVRRYNGSGWKAHRYAWRVFYSRRNIFGLPLPDTPKAKAAEKYQKYAKAR